MKYLLMDETHVQAVAELEKICFSDPWSANSIMSEVHNPLSCWYVAMDGDRLVGYIGSQSVLGWADMMNLAVHPDYRGQGIGEQLVNMLVDYLMNHDVSCLTLEVRVSNMPARKLYDKLGLSEVGRRPGYYHNPKEDALILRKEWKL